MNLFNKDFFSNFPFSQAIGSPNKYLIKNESEGIGNSIILFF